MRVMARAMRESGSAVWWTIEARITPVRTPSPVVA